MTNQARNYTLNTIKKLYALSGNRCANPDCQRELIKGNTQLGEIAHIKAASPNGPRYDASMTDDERRDYTNLILLCGDCNKIVDGNPEKYPIELLYNWKQKHESCYQESYDKEMNEYLKRLGKCLEQQIGIEDDSFFDIKLTESNNNELCKKHVLAEYILTQIEQREWENFKNLFVKGVAGIGKSTEMKYAYNTIIKVFGDKDNHQKYQFCPFPVYFELKNFQDDFPISLDANNTIVFLDGFDELSEKNVVIVRKKIEYIKSFYPNIRFIISGRDASFHHEFVNNFHSEIIKLSYEINLDNENDRKLYYRYLHSPLFSFVFIPFYKCRALQDEYQNIKNLKQFIETIVDDKLKDDKKRKDYADGISNRQNSLSKVNFENLKKCLSTFCFQLHTNGTRYFTEADVLNIFKNDDFSECFLKSSLIQEHEGKLSFVSNIYYEYFLALYFSTQEISVVRNNLFLSNGKAKVQEIIVISMLLNILNNKSLIYKKIENKLSKQSSTYIFLTDYTTLSPEVRFDFYKKILKEYNDNRGLIYYLRFRSNHNLLANIGSLSDYMIELLPEKFKSEAIDLHRNQVKAFIENPQKKNLVVFANSIILLGLHNQKIWNEEQQNVLKSLSISVFNFFLNNPLAKDLDGLLSFEIILYWYLEYGWADNFSLIDWHSFLVKILPNTPEDFYTLGDESDFKVKLEIFNLFHKQPIVAKLFKSLSNSILNTIFDNGSAGTIPSSIDDDYEGHLIHINHDIIRFGDYLNEINVSCEEILSIFNDSPIENSVYKIRTSERDAVLEGLWKLLNKCAEKFGKENSFNLFRFIKRYLDEGQFMFQDQVNNFCAKLNSDAKISLLSEILKDKQFVAGENTWHHCSVVVELLNNSNIEFSKGILSLIKITSPKNHQLIVRNIACQKENHLLKAFCNEILPAVDPITVSRIESTNAALAKFEFEKREMLSNEINIIYNKNELLKEIHRVSEFVEKMVSTKNYRSAWDVLQGMELDSIEHNIRWSYKEKYISDVYSAFVISFLKQNKFLKNTLIDCNAINKEIDEYFASENVFWRYIYTYYVYDKKVEDVKEIFSSNKDLVERIKKSMQAEVTKIIKQSFGAFFDKENRNYWMKPFFYFSALLYDSKLPDWFDHNKVLDFVICADIYYELHYHKKDLFTCDSIFKWLEVECNVAKTKLIESSIKCYEEVNIDSIKSRIIYFLSEVDDSKAIYFVIKQTKKEISECVERREIQYALTHYWRTVKFDKIEEIGSFIPFDKFLNKSEDSSSDLIDALVDYFCNYASTEQKKKAIVKVCSLEGSKKQELLMNLGEENAISNAIDEYLNGANVNSNLDHSLYEVEIIDDKLYEKFIELYEYTFEKSNERRRILGNWALCVIKENTSVKRYDTLKKKLERIIEIRKENGDYWEGLQDILDEVEQKLYDNILKIKGDYGLKGKNFQISSLVAKRIYISWLVLPIIILIICIPIFGWDKIEPITYIVSSLEVIVSGVLCFIDGKYKSPFQRIEDLFANE